MKKRPSTGGSTGSASFLSFASDLRRIVRKTTHGQSRLCVETRPGSANQGETAAFMDGKKPILVFSDAGGTGRSYHSDLGAVNQATRAHYLLEPGWRADAAVQGLGRTNRTNQKHPPIFRPVATNVKGEKRFLSTIARRLDSLGALTKGQRQTGRAAHQGTSARTRPGMSPALGNPRRASAVGATSRSRAPVPAASRRA